MLSPRLAIIAAACLFALYVVSSAWNAIAPRTSGRQAQDSHGIGRPGYRGLVDVLEALGTPVERRVLPPGEDLPQDATLLLWAPDPKLVALEPAHLRAVARWVEQGGRVVLAPGQASAVQQAELDKLSEELEHYNAKLLPALGLEGVTIEQLISSNVPEDSPGDDPELVISQIVADEAAPGGTDVKELVTLGEALPVVETDDDVTVAWRTRMLDADGDERALALAVPKGDGEVIVVSDPTLLSNVALGRGDNSVWAFDLLTDGGTRRVIVDEFYHGLSVRGNAWWLLGQPQYAMVAAAVVLLLAVATWRAGVLLGPPLASREPSRRAIGEYIESMGRFFRRGRNADVYLLGQIRDGVWRRLCHLFGVPPATHDLERLLAAIGRRDPARSSEVREAWTKTDEVLNGKKRATEATVVEAMGKLSACLTDVRTSEPRPSGSERSSRRSLPDAPSRSRL
jgi:hypothetical protein